MTQLFNISIDGVDVTERFDTGNISEEMNRIYDVATFTIDNSATIIEEKEVVINYGSKTFTGFVYSVGKTGKNSLRVEARTYPAKLTEPYSPHEVRVDDASTSHELCALYASESGVPITITAANLDFGGSYERSGTMLNALLNMASVTGAEYYDDGGTVKIVPNKAIDVEGVEIPESDIFDFVADSSSVYNKGVGYITIENAGDLSSDIISINSIYAEVDECTGELFVYPNPNGLIEHSTGTSPLKAIITQRKEERALLDDDVITLDAAIESIVSITLNGADITDYNYEQGHNVLYFNTLVRGTLKVVYKAYGYKGYTNITVTSVGRFVTFDLYYLDQVLLFQGFLSPDCSNVSTDGDLTCIVPTDMYYNAGFDVYTIGGDPKFTFFANHEGIVRTVTPIAVNYISVEKATLEEMPGGKWVYAPRYPMGNDLGVRSAGVDISYAVTTIESVDVLELDRYYPKVEVSYEAAATQHHVQFSKVENSDITMVIKNQNTDQVCEYALEYKIPCELNQDISVDLVAKLGVEVVDVAGKTVPYLDPASDTHSVAVDSFGVVKIYVTMNGEYVINTGTLKSKTTVVLTVNV